VLVEAGERHRGGCKASSDAKGATEKISAGMKVISFGPDDQKRFRTAFKAVWRLVQGHHKRANRHRVFKPSRPWRNH